MSPLISTPQSLTWIASQDGAVWTGDLSNLRDEIVRWKANGETLVFTNGCFDLLHAGHLKLLHESVCLGDRLIVAVNSDSSVRGLKGDSRPIQSQEVRCALLAEFRCVDAVVCFDGPDPGWLVEILRPDVMVKGADYRGRRVAGSEFCNRLHYVELLGGNSTSAIIARTETRQPM